MTDKTFDSGWLWAGALSFFLAGAVVAHFSNEFILAYPLDQWRMDLDDFIGNIGTLMVGLGALFGYRRANRKIASSGTQKLEAEITAAKEKLNQMERKLEEMQ